MGPHDTFLKRQREFYEAYGYTMAQWATMEYVISSLFVAMTKMREEVGREVFYSARSFLGRSDMFLAAAKHARTVPAGRTFLIDAMSLAREWART